MPTTNGGLSVLRTLGVLLLIASLAITGYFFMASDTSVKKAAFVPVTPMNIAQKAFPSVVMIVMEDADGQSNTMGSGFFVSEGVVASNFHVIEGTSRGFVKIIGDETMYEIDGIIALDELHDLVLLQVKAANAPLLSLGDSKNLAIGEEVFVVGNPEGFEGTFSKGIVSGIRESEDKRYVQITAPISHGSSGGPVLNGKAEVIGVTVATHESGQNLNFAIPSQYLKELLAKKGGLKPIQSSSKRVTQN
jgi:S1-C subfamily serine protease